MRPRPDLRRAILNGEIAEGDIEYKRGYRVGDTHQVGGISVHGLDSRTGEGGVSMKESALELGTQELLHHLNGDRVRGQRCRYNVGDRKSVV